MRVLFSVYGYSPEVEPLQPWLTVCRIAEQMIQAGWEVHILTDVPGGSSLQGVHVHIVKTMRPGNSEQVLAVIGRIRPHRIVVLATPMNLLLPGWCARVDSILYAFLSYPFYTRLELARALPYLNKEDMKTYIRHGLVPDYLWGRTLRRHFAGVIGQSRRTANRVASIVGGSVTCHSIPAGIDRAFWSPPAAPRPAATGKRFLFLGSPKSIRGFDLVLDAFGRVCRPGVELRVLARGASPDETGIIKKRMRCKLGRAFSQASIQGGWVDQEQLREEIRQAHVVVLPFVLVPSEFPVSVMECIACGTPVITTDIDGLPEVVGNGGWIVRSGSITQLTEIMRQVSESESGVRAASEHCLEQRSKMISWREAGEQWCRLLGREDGK